MNLSRILSFAIIYSIKWFHIYDKISYYNDNSNNNDKCEYILNIDSLSNLVLFSLSKCSPRKGRFQTYSIFTLLGPFCHNLLSISLPLSSWHKKHTNCNPKSKRFSYLEYSTTSDVHFSRNNVSLIVWDMPLEWKSDM